jgi:hypothetical protein
MYISLCSNIIYYTSASLAQTVCNKMLEYENQYKRTHEPLVISLYLHWFLSLIALCECVARFTIHLAAVIVVAVLYYIMYCITCGKSKITMNAWLSGQQDFFGLYSGMFCGIIGNLSNNVNIQIIILKYSLYIL